MAQLPYPPGYSQPIGVVSSDDGVLADVNWFNDGGTELHTVATSKLRPRGALTATYIEQVMQNNPSYTPLS